ncbi:MAG: hypothetical protein IKI64_02875, partial [Clostridia bacterium]|nr:hypothetical protein [Clostridia bacterium]
LIIEENGVLHPIEIKQSANVTADATSAFTVLDRVNDKTRGMGAVICCCPQPGMLRENIIQSSPFGLSERMTGEGHDGIIKM